MTQHTPGPFEIFGDGQITLENGIETDVQVITAKNAYGEDQEIAYALNVLDAAFIVRACNSHEAMLEACKVALANVAPMYSSTHHVVKLLTEAISQAERQEPHP